MTNSTFSKKMCHELLLYEDYLLNCKAVPFKKEMIMVEREHVISLVADLRAYHCANRDLTMPDEWSRSQRMAPEADSAVIPVAEQDGKTEMLAAELAASQENLQEKETTEQALGEELARARAEIAQLQMTYQNVRQQLIGEQAERRRLQEQLEKVQQVAQENVAQWSEEERAHQAKMTQIDKQLAAERAQSLEEAREQVQFLLDDARDKAERMVGEAAECIKAKQEEIDDVLRAKIMENEKQAEAIIDKAMELASVELEANDKKSKALLAAAFNRADNLIEQVEKIYAKQLEVVKNDHQELEGILRVLQKKNAHR